MPKNVAKTNEKEKIARKVNLNLYWSTNAIAIYFPDNIQREISSSLIDLHCKERGSLPCSRDQKSKPENY